MRMDDAREGGALCTITGEAMVVGLRSRQRAETEGKWRLKRDVRLSLEVSPERRRLKVRPPGSSPSLK